jgi:Arc/MetJ-type ribon-helix-helix transcriptional regulator
MIITLTVEQERLIKQQIETVKYVTVNEVISSALSLLANEQF